MPSIKFGEDLVLLMFPRSHFEKHSQFIFQLNHCLPHPFVNQQSLKMLVPSCKQRKHEEILPSPQQGWPSEIAGVFRWSNRPVGWQWIRVSGGVMKSAHLILSLSFCQLYGQRNEQWAEYLWVGYVETVCVNFTEIFLVVTAGQNLYLWCPNIHHYCCHYCPTLLAEDKCSTHICKLCIAKHIGAWAHCVNVHDLMFMKEQQSYVFYVWSLTAQRAS